MGLLDFVRGGKKPSKSTIRTAQDVQKEQHVQQLPPPNPSALPFIPQYLEDPRAGQQQTEGIQFTQQPGAIEPPDPMAGFMTPMEEPIRPKQNSVPQDLAMGQYTQNNFEPDTVSAVLSDNNQPTNPVPPFVQTEQYVNDIPPMPMFSDFKMPVFPIIPGFGDVNQNGSNSTTPSDQDEFTSMSDLANSRSSLEDKSLEDLLKVDLPPLPRLGVTNSQTQSDNTQETSAISNSKSAQLMPEIDLPPIPNFPPLPNFTKQSSDTVMNTTDETYLDSTVQDETVVQQVDQQNQVDGGSIINPDPAQVQSQSLQTTQGTETPVQDEFEVNAIDATNFEDIGSPESIGSEITQNDLTLANPESQMHTALNQDIASPSQIVSEAVGLVDPQMEAIIGDEVTPVVETAENQGIFQDQLAEEKIEEAIPAFSPRRVISKIAFLGLDGGVTDQSTGNALVSVVKDLVKNKFEIVIDSKKGYGEHISQTAASVKAGVKGIFLKPYLSNDFSLPAKQLTESFNTSLVYSNYIERLKSIFSNSDVFVFFETGGLYNISLMTTLWAISKMYLGQNKPMVLVGDGWKKKIEALKELIGLTKSDVDAVIQISSILDLSEKLSQIENNYQSKTDMMNVEKVIDKRIEGDESDFIVLPA